MCLRPQRSPYFQFEIDFVNIDAQTRQKVQGLKTLPGFWEDVFYMLKRAPAINGSLFSAA
jgi:hypothetical protein